MNELEETAKAIEIALRDIDDDGLLARAHGAATMPFRLMYLFELVRRQQKRDCNRG